ncbi:uncharacterized protein TNIN_486561 [Trichonephila inaurata madagascariensis]|uniref:Uncharacterized protein n=1 Tax=Trichonephila inaurata madagascariensis TaxID=2747483 RepID=A0A8X6Y7R6_9ARAC|nr:uncharacterized protein TNIN_486561 [Trichonephila inaurata madagascariensis]
MFAKLKTNPQTPQESNPITQYFEIGKHVASAGPELVWKIHEAVRKSDKRLSSWPLEVFVISRWAKIMSILLHKLPRLTVELLTSIESHQVMMLCCCPVYPLDWNRCRGSVPLCTLPYA